MPASVPCPICRKSVPVHDPNMPFCSDRCREIDLGNWATEKYAIPSTGRSELEDFGEGDEDAEGRDR